QGRVHVVHVRDAVQAPHGCRDKGGLFYGMDQVVSLTSHHAQTFRKHEQVADDLLHRKSGSDIVHPKRPRDAMDPAVRDLDVLALVKSEHVYLMTSSAEKLQHGLYGQRSTAGLEE